MIIARHSAVAALAIIFGFTANFFISQAIIKIGDSLSQKQKLSELLSLRIENTRQLKNSLALLGDNDQKIQNLYPPTDNILNFVSALDGIAKQNSLQQNLNFGGFMSADDISGITAFKTDYAVGFSGTIKTLSSYLKQMENMPFASSIGSVNLLASPPGGWASSSNITINGTLYARQIQ